jgi:ABC-2 type transport system ATP-binding protein
VRELSKGNRQKIGLVLAFTHHPELLVLDEPTSGLDPLMQHEFENLLRETAGQGRTVFLSSHELDEVQDPVDLVRCPVGLDELFLGFYRESPDSEVSHAG